MAIAISANERYKRKAAIAMYDAGFSMRVIQKEFNNVTVEDIRYWSSIKGQKEALRSLAKGKRLAKKSKRTKKQRKKERVKTAKTWKKRVFDSWKDTPEQAAKRRSLEYQEWRKIVLERDNYTCQHCEKTGGRLVVHHLKTFKMYPELRFELDNGIVLCNKCHEKLHLDRVSKPRILRIPG